MALEAALVGTLVGTFWLPQLAHVAACAGNLTHMWAFLSYAAV